MAESAAWRRDASEAAAAYGETWKFDNLQSIGGHTVKVMGNPKVIDTPKGKAIEFDGVDDAIFLEVHPLAGATTFTWEAIFRPDKGGIADAIWGALPYAVIMILFTFLLMAMPWLATWLPAQMG